MGFGEVPSFAVAKNIAFFRWAVGPPAVGLAQVLAERGGFWEALGLRRRELAAWEAAVGAEDPRTR